jgi:hypothetical protein
MTLTQAKKLRIGQKIYSKIQIYYLLNFPVVWWVISEPKVYKTNNQRIKVKIQDVYGKKANLTECNIKDFEVKTNDTETS